MPEPKKPKQDKKLSLHPLEFEEALKGLLATPPPKEGQGKKNKPATKRRRKTIENKGQNSHARNNEAD